MKKKSTAHPGETSTLTKAVDTLFSTLRNEMGFTFAALSRINTFNRTLYTIRADGVAAVQQKHPWSLEELSDNDTLLKVISSKKLIVRKRLTQSEKNRYTDEVPGNLIRIFVPLTSADTVTGILETGFQQGVRPDISLKEQRLLKTLAQQTAIFIENQLLIAQLHQERHLLHTLMDNIPDSIYFKDTDSRFIRASRALAEKFGIPDPQALIGKTDFDLFTNEHAQQAFADEQQIFCAVLNTGGYAVHKVLIDIIRVVSNLVWYRYLLPVGLDDLLT